MEWAREKSDVAYITTQPTHILLHKMGDMGGVVVV
jgi:hypothetical protein